ncbi:MULTISPECIES: hypothetical protein [unclassified Leptolyngbya]|uniref:hypothetical protein n=1 Tax=unclassified Leptolyngbya TaxID=2650499 RepID=UPI0016891D61|nr:MULTISPECIES: hypothetical protein [unclassified Leptolyngbya]MBD1912166.1 hypothetical protein [Leptolyngbya sp. FACHB-8]MBD2155057.1 hypothetical protein [Leptolyngbya sp. FACHB-16]
MLTQFVQVEVPLQNNPAHLERAIAQTLQTHGDPLRWAITGIDAVQGIARIEAVVTISTRVV